MTYSIYIDYPSGRDSYEFITGEKYGSDVVSRKLGLSVKFVCNSIAKLSAGDVYEIVFEQEEDMTAFILKSKYTILDRHKIEEYKKQ